MNKKICDTCYLNLGIVAVYGESSHIESLANKFHKLADYCLELVKICETQEQVLQWTVKANENRLRAQELDNQVADNRALGIDH